MIQLNLQLKCVQKERKTTLKELIYDILYYSDTPMTGFEIRIELESRGYIYTDSSITAQLRKMTQVGETICNYRTDENYKEWRLVK